MESANSDQPMESLSFWDETPFDSSADMDSNQTVAVPPNIGDSSNYNDDPWSNAVAPSPATTSDVPPYSAPSYPPNDFYYMQYPIPYSESSSLPAQDHNDVASNSQLEKVTYSHKEQAHFFQEAVSIGRSPAGHPFVPQAMYKPHTSSDHHRYVEEVNLDPPIYFWVQDPSEYGLALSDALQSRFRHLIDCDEPMFKDRGSSVSVRIEVSYSIPFPSMTVIELLPSGLVTIHGVDRSQ